jgi:transposase
MVHVHGAQAQQLARSTRGVDPAELVAVPIDVGKHAATALVCDFAGELLARPFEFPMTMAGVALLVERVQAATHGRVVRLVRVGVEAAGHYHQPLVSVGVLPADWPLVQVNPAQVAAQRQVTGRRRLKTDALDLVAISDLLRAGHGAGQARLSAVMGELAAWVAHRERRVATRTATKNQLLGQVDRTFPGLSGCLSSLFGTKVGRLVLAEFTDPARLACLGVAGFQQTAAGRGVQVLAPVAERLVRAAQVAIPTDQAPIARTMVDRDLTLLAALEAQVAEADKRLATLLPRTPFAVLCSGPGWRVVRAATYAAAVGDPARWPSARHVYRASGLCPSDLRLAPVAATTARSAEKGRSPCGGRCCRWAWGCGGWTRPPAPTPPPCGPAASHPGSSPPPWPTAPTGSRSPWSATSDPTTPTGGGEPGFPVPVGRARLVGWEAGSDAAGDLAGRWSRRGKLGARPPVTQQNPDEVS